MSWVLSLVASAGLAAWLYLLLARGGFWLTRERLCLPAAEPTQWPAVVAVVPARNEAEVIGRTLPTLLRQDYPGRLDVVLVDDHSEDGTAEVAARAAGEGGSGRLTVAHAGPLPAGWVGKVWAMSQGLAEADRIVPEAAFVWFTDADIEHDPDSLRRLVAKAESEGRDLVSVMALLSCRTFWERLLIPPFVLFFQKLYPFAWVNEPGRELAAAAGGCVLLRREALRRAGGLASVRGAVIDDCALARLVRRDGREHGPASLWLGLSHGVRSVRPYEGLEDIWAMVARSAYTQLDHSPAMLVLTLVGMTLFYLAPPAIVLTYPWHGDAAATLAAGAAWGLIALALAPTLRFYGQPLVLAPLLPLAALLYCAMTVDSWRAHRRGRGGAWKGRAAGEIAGTDAVGRR